MILTSVEAEIRHAWALCSAVSSALDGAAATLDAGVANPKLIARIAKTKKFETDVFEDTKKLMKEVQLFLISENGNLYQYDFELNGVAEGGYLVMKDGRVVKKWPVLSGSYAYFSKPPARESK